MRTTYAALTCFHAFFCTHFHVWLVKNDLDGYLSNFSITYA